MKLRKNSTDYTAEEVQEISDKLEFILKKHQKLKRTTLNERFCGACLIQSINEGVGPPDTFTMKLEDSFLRDLIDTERTVKFYNPDAFTEIGKWIEITKSNPDISEYFADGKVPYIFKYISETIKQYDYWVTNDYINYILDHLRIQVRQSCWGGRVFEAELVFNKVEMVECCITEEEVPKSLAYYNGDVYISEDAYQEFTRCNP